MSKRFKVKMSVEETRDLFVREFVQRRSGSIGKETGLAGFADPRRRFVLAIQGWEKNVWIRPLVTRLEGWYEKTPDNNVTYVHFVRRGLTLPIFIIGLLLPYTAARTVISELPPTLNDWIVIGVTTALLLVLSALLLRAERRTYKMLEETLLLTFGKPDLIED